MEKSASPRRRGRAPLGPRIFGGGALVVGILAFLLAYFDLRDGRDAEFTPVNAAFAPLIITGMWVVFAAIYFVKQLINPYADYPEFATEPESAEPDESDADDEAVEPDADSADAHPADVKWLPPVLVTVALLVYVLVLDIVGFLIMTPLFFVAVTVVFGSRRFVRDAAVGIVLTLATYYLFTIVLGLPLAEGVFAR